jgi:PPOX class probable F420-dependent enzyme
VLQPEVRRLLEGTAVAHLATVLPDGSPHCVPVFVGAEGDRVVIFTGPESRKARNLRRDPRVALSLAPPDNPFSPVIVRGRVTEWLDGDAAWEAASRWQQASRSSGRKPDGCLTCSSRACAGTISPAGAGMRLTGVAPGETMAVCLTT